PADALSRAGTLYLHCACTEIGELARTERTGDHMFQRHNRYPIKRTHRYQSSVTRIPQNLSPETRRSYRRRIEFGEPALMPIRISHRGGAGGIEPGDLRCCQLPA